MVDYIIGYYLLLHGEGSLVSVFLEMKHAYILSPFGLAMWIYDKNIWIYEYTCVGHWIYDETHHEAWDSVVCLYLFSWASAPGMNMTNSGLFLWPSNSKWDCLWSTICRQLRSLEQNSCQLSRTVKVSWFAFKLKCSFATCMDATEDI